MLKNLFLSDHETFMSDGKNKKINTILDGYKPEESSKQITEKICSESADSKRERDTYRIRTGDVLMSEVKRNWSRDAKTVFFNIFSVNGMCTDEISKGIFFENETSKKIFLQSLATNSLRITDFTDCFESSAVADIKLAGAKEEIMTTSFWVVDIVRECRCIPEVREILKIEKELSYVTYMHSISTAIYSTMIADSYTQDLDILKKITIGALVHDVGKAAIAKNVLEKKGKLTDTEMKLIRKHCVIGAEMIADMFDKEVQQIVLMHHEKLDGSGYPLGTTEIPSYVQLVTVADIYDALVSNRCYKKAYSHEKAIEMLRKEAVQNKINKKYVERINALRQPN